MPRNFYVSKKMPCIIVEIHTTQEGVEILRFVYRLGYAWANQQRRAVLSRACEEFNVAENEAILNTGMSQQALKMEASRPLTFTRRLCLIINPNRSVLYSGVEYARREEYRVAPYYTYQQFVDRYIKEEAK